MNGLEVAAQILGIISAFAAVFLAILAFKTYRDLTPSAQLRRNQDEHMDHLAALVMQILSRITILRESHISRQPVAGYLFPAFSHDARQLDSLLDRSSQLGLIQKCLADSNLQDANADRWGMNTAFRTSIVEMANFDSSKFHTLDPSSYEYLDSEDHSNAQEALVQVQHEFVKLHFFLGIIRLGDSCIAYGEISTRGELSNLLEKLTQLDAPRWTPAGEAIWSGEDLRVYSANYIRL